MGAWQVNALSANVSALDQKMERVLGVLERIKPASVRRREKMQAEQGRAVKAAPGRARGAAAANGEAAAGANGAGGAPPRERLPRPRSDTATPACEPVAFGEPPRPAVGEPPRPASGEPQLDA